jgi:SAM-dependent methyltransferase
MLLAAGLTGVSNRTITMPEAYRDDLAYIHDTGFGQFAQNAAPALLAELRQRQVDRGLVIDLGCGSGIVSEAVAAARFDVLGIDISPGMLALARKRVPGGRFIEGSLLTAELPPCVAVAAVGECINYLFDRGNNKAALARLFRRIHAALRPGGLFLLDVAGPGRVPGGGPQRTFREGGDWVVLVIAEEDRRRGVLTRQITSFRKVGTLYRRDHEVHEQRLLGTAEITTLLRDAGFRVRRLRGYGPLPFGPGHAGFLARRV